MQNLIGRVLCLDGSAGEVPTICIQEDCGPDRPDAREQLQKHKVSKHPRPSLNPWCRGRFSTDFSCNHHRSVLQYRCRMRMEIIDARTRNHGVANFNHQ